MDTLGSAPASLPPTNMNICAAAPAPGVRAPCLYTADFTSLAEPELDLDTVSASELTFICFSRSAERVYPSTVLEATTSCAGPLGPAKTYFISTPPMAPAATTA